MSFISLMDSVTISEVESETISETEITAILELKRREYDYKKLNFVWRIVKCYHGKTTRPLTRQQTQSADELIGQKIEMEEEAKKAALMECFRDHFGFTEFNDLVYDELHRPLKLSN